MSASEDPVMVVVNEQSVHLSEMKRLLAGILDDGAGAIFHKGSRL